MSREKRFAGWRFIVTWIGATVLFTQFLGLPYVLSKPGVLQNGTPVFHDGGRLTLYYMAIFWFMRESLSVGDGSWRIALTRRNTQYRITALLTGLGLMGLFWIGMYLPSQSETLARVTGSAAVLAGIFMRATAIAFLGDRFVTAAETEHEEPIIEQGPYCWIRHPSETGVLLIACGAAVISGQALVMGLAGFVLLTVLWRIRIEDRALQEVYGEAFADYRQRVGGLLPKPWVSETTHG